jgi:hypothetical protein
VVFRSHADIREGPLGEFGDRMADPAGQDAVVGLILLIISHAPWHHIGGKRPVANRSHVAEHHLQGQPKLDRGGRPGDLPAPASSR